MATIKDIAKAAGVSQGTVSNVLNGKDNVSSDKIRRVMGAVAEMGYTINERARNLRRGSAKTLAVVLPNFRDRPYLDFYSGFTACAEQAGYSVDLHHTDDDPESERRCIPLLRSRGAQGVAVFSSIQDGSQPYYDAGFEKKDVLFVGRPQPFESPYLGFDMYGAGCRMAEYVAKKGYRRAALLLEPVTRLGSGRFYDGFMETLTRLEPECEITDRVTTTSYRYQNVVNLFANAHPQVVVTENIALAQAVENLRSSFYKSSPVEICTFSPVFVFPEDSFTRYEADYRELGRAAAERLIHSGAHAPQTQLLEARGFSCWPSQNTEPTGRSLTMASGFSHTTQVLQCLTELYRENTGTRVQVEKVSHQELYDRLQSGEPLPYDIVRMDVDWFRWFGPSCLTPLDELDPWLASRLDGFLPGTKTRYSTVDGRLLALPSAVSVQLLLYRKDLFGDVGLRRLFFETYHEPLEPPKTYEQYNRIARFFTRKLNPSSPTLYGATLVTGEPSVAGVEYLTRYFSHNDDLFDLSGQLRIQSKAGRQAMEEMREAAAGVSGAGHKYWDSAIREFARGETAMCICFTTAVSELVSPDSRVADKFGWTCVPGGNAMMSGAVVGITTSCADREAALDLLRWVSRDDIATAQTLMGGISARTEAYRSSAALAAYPWLSLARRSCRESRANCYPPSGGENFDLQQMEYIIGSEVIRMLDGHVTVEQALQNITRQYEKEFAAGHHRRPKRKGNHKNGTE